MLEKHHDMLLRTLIKDDQRFSSVMREIYLARDKQILEHLTTAVFYADAFSLLRLICKLSKRECHLIEQSFKYEHRANGTKVRHMLCADSTVPAPSLFNVAAIAASERSAELSSKLLLHEHSDRRGADVSGRPGGLDQAIFNGLEATKTDRTGGMATKGTAADPHLIALSGDGAGLTQ